MISEEWIDLINKLYMTKVSLEDPAMPMKGMSMV